MHVTRNYPHHLLSLYFGKSLHSTQSAARQAVPAQLKLAGNSITKGRRGADSDRQSAITPMLFHDNIR